MLNELFPYLYISKNMTYSSTEPTCILGATIEAHDLGLLQGQLFKQLQVKFEVHVDTGL